MTHLYREKMTFLLIWGKCSQKQMNCPFLKAVTVTEIQNRSCLLSWQLYLVSNDMSWQMLPLYFTCWGIHSEAWQTLCKDMFFFLCHRYLVLYVEMYIDEQHILLVLSEIYSAKSCCLYNVFYEYFSHFLNDSECYIGARFFVLLSF